MQALLRLLRPRIVAAIGIVTLCVIAPIGSTDERAIAVLYPDLNDYNAVFESIAAGVQSKVSGPVQRIPLPENYSPSELKQWFASRSVKAVIALGRRGLEATEKIEWSSSIAVSAVVWDSSLRARQLTGISLDPDPRTALGYVRMLAPKIRRIHTIVNGDQSLWLMERARIAAVDLGFTLVVKEVPTKRAAAVAYREALSTLNPEHDALWLPLDPTFDESTLRDILVGAWNRQLVVFSSNPDHAQRGTLFSLYPDYHAIGQRLAGLLQEQSPEPTTRSFRPMTDVKLAVNLRTARHLGLEFTRDVDAKIAVKYK